MNTLSRAHRILKSLKRYRDLANSQALPAEAPRLPELRADEKAIGIYINDAFTFSDLVLFTTIGLYVFRSGKWEHVDFVDVVRPVTPDSKENVFGLTLELHDGRSFSLPLIGSCGRSYDAFEVLRFLDRVLSDAANKRPNSEETSI